ncbi:MAG: transporter substrate-binding domain-containing protein [Desulfobacterales bacterium]|nr:transporter substrate-binding domain-containing protein [Desulfobacterales bacterium]
MRNYFIFFCLLLTVICFSSPVSAGRLTILTEDSPPGNFIDESGQLTGSCVEIVREIMRRLGHEEKIRVLPWARAYKMVLQNPDMMLFSTTRTVQRENLFKWVGPLLQIEWVFLARKDSGMTITSLDDARTVNRIGTYREDAREQFLLSKGFSNLHPANEMRHLLRMLNKNRLDLVATAKVAYSPHRRKNPVPMDNFRIAHTFKNVALYMAFSKMTDDKIVDQWQQAYTELEDEGFITAVRQKWLR